MLHRVKFYRHLLQSWWRIFCDVFLLFFLDDFKSDCLLRTMSDAVKSVWQAFENYVTV